MDLNQMIKLHQGDKEIELPLINILRINFIHMNRLKEEWQKANQDNNVNNFWLYLKRKLGITEGSKILL